MLVRSNPNARGSITLETKIVHGRVMNASTSANATGDNSVAACIEGLQKNGDLRQLVREWLPFHLI